MVGTKAKSSVEASNASKTGSISTNANKPNCVVAQGTKIEGNFKSVENLRLDGTIVGELNCEKKLVMGGNSYVEGKLIAAEAVIMGKVKGELKIEGTLHLMETCEIQGNIVAKYLVVEEGAKYNGNCKVGV